MAKSVLDSTLRKLRENNREGYARSLELATDICKDIGRFALNETTIIGGYAVLAHLADEGNDADETIRTWRGSHDVDIVSRDHNLKSLIQTRTGKSRLRKSHFSTENIEKYALPDSNTGSELDIYIVNSLPAQFSGGDYEFKRGFFEGIERKEIADGGLLVPNIYDLMDLKLSVKDETGMPRDKDILDILALRKRLMSQGETDLSIAKKLDDGFLDVYDTVVKRY